MNLTLCKKEYVTLKLQSIDWISNKEAAIISTSTIERALTGIVAPKKVAALVPLMCHPVF
jgi:molybdenum cofactor biosynthesis enzyme